MKRTTSILDLVRECTSLCLRDSNVHCEISCPEDLWTAEAEEGRICYALNSLIINAIQSMPESGTLKIEMHNLELDKADARLASVVEPGKYVRITIRDQGINISESKLTKIFNPFLTTTDRHIGLDLTGSRQHKGLITIMSEEISCSAFEVYLKPVAMPSVAPVFGEPESKGPVLVMDDAQNVRDMIVKMLQKLGFKTGIACNGEEAIEKYQSAMQSESPYQLIIMDLAVVGGMGGQQAVQKLLEIDPHLKAIVSSGHAYDPVVSEYSKHGFKGAIVKPYTLAEINREIQRVISQE